MYSVSAELVIETVIPLWFFKYVSRAAKKGHSGTHAENGSLPHPAHEAHARRVIKIRAMPIDGIFAGTGGNTEVYTGDFTTPAPTIPAPDASDEDADRKRDTRPIKIRWAEVHNEEPDAIKIGKRFNLLDVIAIVTGYNRLWGKGRPKAVAAWLEKMACMGDTVSSGDPKKKNENKLL